MRLCVPSHVAYEVGAARQQTVFRIPSVATEAPAITLEACTL